MNIPEDVIIAEQLKYTPPNDTLDHMQRIAQKRMMLLSDDAFITQTAGLKSAFDLLMTLVFDDGLNELAGALEVITRLCSVDNQRYYDLLKDHKYADLLAVMAGAK